MAPEVIRTPDFIRASLLRALGARLVSTESDGGRCVVVLDLSAVRDTLEHNITALIRELGAARDAATGEGAANTVIDNTFLAMITAHLSDLKRRI